MNAFTSNSLKLPPKFVLLVPCLVLFAACASKEIKNASLEPLDLPAEESSTYSAPEPQALVKKSAKKSKKTTTKMARAQKQKRTLRPAAPVTTAAAAQVQSNQDLPVIGDESLSTAPIQVDPMAPPVPFDTGFENLKTQPNWLLAGLVIAGIVLLMGLTFRIRRMNKGKRRLVYNA
jgi:cytoskeletal protein RodZ